MGDSGNCYELGSGKGELARLEIQGKAVAPATRMIFAAAGIRAGMRVLDLGCGTGDVAFVTADLAGPEGHVSASTARRNLSAGPGSGQDKHDNRQPGSAGNTSATTTCASCSALRSPQQPKELALARTAAAGAGGPGRAGGCTQGAARRVP